MNYQPNSFPKVKKFIYQFGYKRIQKKYYPAYYRAWVLSQLGVQVTRNHVEHELKITNKYLERTNADLTV